MTKSQIRQLHLYHVLQKWKDKSRMLTNLSSVQTTDTNALVDLLIIFHAVSFFGTELYQIYKSNTCSSLNHNHSESWCLRITFSHLIIINTLTVMWLMVNPWRCTLEKRLFFFCFKMSFSLKKNLSYQQDFQNLHYKHHGVVLSNFLQVTKCFQLLLIY